MDMVGIIVIALLLGVIPAAVAQRKGYGFVEWWLFGALLFVVALPAAFIIKPLPPATDGPGR